MYIHISFVVIDNCVLSTLHWKEIMVTYSAKWHWAHVYYWIGLWFDAWIEWEAFSWMNEGVITNNFPYIKPNENKFATPSVNFAKFGYVHIVNHPFIFSYKMKTKY